MKTSVKCVISQLDNDGDLILRIKHDDIKVVKNFHKKIKNIEKETGVIKELELTLDTDIKKRSNQQNALMWKLYAMMIESQGEIVTKEKKDWLYYNDLKEYAPRVKHVYTSREHINCEYIENEQSIDNNGKIEYHVTEIIGTSQFKKEIMTRWIEMLIKRLCEIGVDYEHEHDLYKIWKENKMYQNEEQIILYAKQKITQDKYKELVPICEASGKYLKYGGGSLAHIKARGMGGDNPLVEYPGNWLHLADPIHKFQHDKGWGEFLKEYPHLEYKVNKALGGL